MNSADNQYTMLHAASKQLIAWGMVLGALAAQTQSRAAGSLYPMHAAVMEIRTRTATLTWEETACTIDSRNSWARTSHK